MSYERNVSIGATQQWGEQLVDVTTGALSEALDRAAARGGFGSQMMVWGAKTAVSVAVAEGFAVALPLVAMAVQTIATAIGGVAMGVGLAASSFLAAGGAVLGSLGPIGMVVGAVAAIVGFIVNIFEEAGKGKDIVASQWIRECVSEYSRYLVVPTGALITDVAGAYVMDAEGKPTRALRPVDFFARPDPKGAVLPTVLKVAFVALDTVEESRSGRPGMDKLDQKAMRTIRLAIERGDDALGSVLLPIYLDFVASQFRTGRVDANDALFMYLRSIGVPKAYAEMFASGTRGEIAVRVLALLNPHLYMVSNTPYGVAGQLPSLSYPKHLEPMGCWWGDVASVNVLSGLGAWAEMPMPLAATLDMLSKWNVNFGRERVSDSAIRAAAKVAAAKIAFANQKSGASVTLGRGAAKGVSQQAKPPAPKPATPVVREPAPRKPAATTGGGTALAVGLCATAAALGGLLYWRKHPELKAKIRSKLGRRS